jgi:hypothetical protein
VVRGKGSGRLDEAEVKILVHLRLLKSTELRKIFSLKMLMCWSVKMGVWPTDVWIKVDGLWRNWMGRWGYDGKVGFGRRMS